ncbi:hypothetical protein [Spongiactinospora sp. 9N601]|uniref:hypothetical protein n=1 Tax=Spongiactinospora sp. 9N601 TaxID=3375149 RepID=UPI0037A0559D
MGGVGFVLMLIILNVAYVRAGLPVPTSGRSMEESRCAFAGLVAAFGWGAGIVSYGIALPGI